VFFFHHSPSLFSQLERTTVPLVGGDDAKEKKPNKESERWRCGV